jgi:hypothetical protein|tara:strand:- start:62 stop:250 length:189 start_codon:yes stop_codon:yes gene_type:complete
MLQAVILKLRKGGFMHPNALLQIQIGDTPDNNNNDNNTITAEQKARGIAKYCEVMELACLGT